MLAPQVWEEVDQWYLAVSEMAAGVLGSKSRKGFIFHKACSRAWACKLPSMVQLSRSCAGTVCFAISRALCLGSALLSV